MTRRGWWLLLALGWGLVAMGQSDLTEFPPGTTVMAWSLQGQDVPREQMLRLAVESRATGEFRVELAVEAVGTPEELGALGFLGSAFYLQSAGTDLDLAIFLSLFRRREVLEVGEVYQVGGGQFHVERTAEIAEITCLVGSYRSPARPGAEVGLGIALSDPVYFPPLLRLTEDGRVTFHMQLVEYSRP
ncbi:MAG: hypothetical protein ACP5G2_08255 [Candidatus Bipolaricaulaceae bacterium]